MRTPNTISEAIENSSSPPAMRNAGSPIESVRNSQSPISALPARMTAAITAARSATLRRARLGRPWVTREISRHQADRVDHDQQGHQCGNEKFERHEQHSNYALFARI